MDYSDQIDCVWLAVDGVGVLAAMITAGCGPIPAGVLSCPIDVTDIEGLLLDLPSIGEARLNVDVPNPASFIALTERGLFVYDWTDLHRTSVRINAYELVATPTVPLRLGQLPDDLRAMAVRLAGQGGIGDEVLTVR